jgi:hypothetical protein
MKNDRQIDEIINHYAPDLLTGQETVDSIIDKNPQVASELRPELEAVEWLQHARLSLATRPGYISDSRKYLESKIASLPLVSYPHRLFNRYSPQKLAFYITAPVVIVVLIGLIMNSLVLASRISIPGDALYSTKLVSEVVRLALTRDPVEKTELHMQYSRERTTELVELVIDGN